jgi:hypothetical protein
MRAEIRLYRLVREITAMKRLLLSCGVFVLLLVVTACPIEPPPFDNPVDPLNQKSDTDDPGSGPGDEPPEFLYAIGDTGPAGGTIFFVDELEEHAGWTYLEAALADITGFLWDEDVNPAFLDNTSTVFGEGLNNTQAIVAALGVGTAYAARAADEHSEGGFDDWFLPSLEELDALYTNLDAAGDLVNDFGFSGTYYWSSSEINDVSVWAVSFFDGFQLDRDKNTMGDFPFRPVRRF